MRAALALPLLLAACAATPPNTPSGPQPLGLTGQTWLLETLAGAPATAPVSLTFTAERVEGVAPCNRYFGAYAAEGATLGIGPVAATRAACPALEAEQRYLSALTDAASFAIEGDALTILDAGGATLMRFRRA